MRLFLILTALLAIGCNSRAQGPARAQKYAPTPGTRIIATPPVVSWLFKGDLQGGWQDHGWAPREPRKAGEPMRLLMGSYGGWILANGGFKGTFGGLVFRARSTPRLSDYLQVKLDSELADVFPAVIVRPEHRRELEDGWTEIFISMSELNPQLQPFTYVRFHAFDKLPPPALVEIDQVGLTGADADMMKRLEAAENAPGEPAAFIVDCDAATQDISPLIYGIAYNARLDEREQYLWQLKPTSRRWGGNTASRYNWELGNAWNTASDWFFENVNFTGHADYSWRLFLEQNRDRGVGSAITLPTLGWVAKDTSSVSFPKSQFPQQQAFDGWRPEAGNGLAKDGTPLKAGSPLRTSVAAPPEFVARWASAIRARQQELGGRTDVLFLDNEPALWDSTHRDVHPEPLSYDELLDRTVRYGTAIRKAYPEALIAGPAEWGWPGYFYSAVDAKAGFLLKPDRRAHGDVPLVEWWLRKLAEHEKKTGVKLLDVLDFHFYPQADGVGVGTSGKTDPQTNALRLRTTRGLWDPRYLDESWIKEPVQLIPRMREIVERNYPGLKLAIGEYSFGAEKHLSGGLALAEALGRFGQEGLYAAWYWTYPAENTPAFWAFRAYTDFDGKGARFEDFSMPTTVPPEASLFAARSGDKSRVTLVALNLSPTQPLEASINLKGCARPDTQRVFTFVGDARGFASKEVPIGKAYRLPAYSITVIELNMPKKK
ncbi:MAG: glycoside hydrolase family 44 protein [Myxococcota bacterium]